MWTNDVEGRGGLGPLRGGGLWELLGKRGTEATEAGIDDDDDDDDGGGELMGGGGATFGFTKWWWAGVWFVGGGIEEASSTEEIEGGGEGGVATATFSSATTLGAALVAAECAVSCSSLGEDEPAAADALFRPPSRDRSSKRVSSSTSAAPEE